jgi:hypothetical protein
MAWVVTVACGFDVIEEAIRIGQALPDVGIGEEAAILRV